jgi:hypothetical protein
VVHPWIIRIDMLEPSNLARQFAATAFSKKAEQAKTPFHLSLKCDFGTGLQANRNSPFFDRAESPCHGTREISRYQFIFHLCWSRFDMV